MRKDEQVEFVTYADMLNMVSEESGLQIMNIVMNLDSPFHAMCTLAICMANIIASVTDSKKAIDENMDELNAFTKDMAYSYLKNREHNESENDKPITVN
jgi:C4-dicarboxylate transporter